MQAPTRLQARTSDREMFFLPLILMLGKGAPVTTAMYNIMHLYRYIDIACLKQTAQAKRPCKINELLR